MTIQKEKIIFALYLSILSPKKDFVDLLCRDVALRRLENTIVVFPRDAPMARLYCQMRTWT